MSRECGDGLLDTVRVGHVYALGKGTYRDVQQGFHQLHTRGLVFPVEIIKVTTAGHEDGAVGAMALEGVFEL